MGVDIKKLRTVLMVLLTVILLVSMGMILRQELQYRAGEETYQEAETLAHVPVLQGAAEPVASGSDVPAPPSYLEQIADIDLTALQAVNSDVIGWILIPGTVISYPIVQGVDNDYYLKHTWKGDRSSVGAIFLDCGSDAGLNGFHAILYGHHMKNGSMFAGLRSYRDRDFWAAHPTVYINIGGEGREYPIFAVYEASVYGDTYQQSFADDAVKSGYLSGCFEQSVYETGVVPTADDSILTLSTCTGRGHETRWVVQCVRDVRADG